MGVDTGLMPRSWAMFSSDRAYRYALFREWGEESKLVVIGLNPSTADEYQDDPTIRRCIGYAKAWGHGGLVMLNLFAFRATQPGDMKAAAMDPIGPDNDAAIRMYTELAPMVLCAWGAHGSYRDRDSAVLYMLTGPDAHPRRRLHCLGRTRHGHPKHPLYLRADLQPISYP